MAPGRPRSPRIQLEQFDFAPSTTGLPQLGDLLVSLSPAEHREFSWGFWAMTPIVSLYPVIHPVYT